MSILNATQIKSLKPKDKDYSLSDGQGLQLLIKKSGSKLWEFRYTSPVTLKRRKTSLGTYPTVSLLDARTKRNDYLKLISNNIDPIETKREEKEKIKEESKKTIYTLEYIVDKYLDLKQHNQKLKDITISKAHGRLENHIYKYLPKKEKTLIFDISFKMLINILERLENENKLETLDRIKRLLIEVYKFAYTENIIKDTETFAKLEIKTFKKVSKADVKNHPTLTDINEIRNLVEKMNNYQGEVITKYALLLSVHSAQRQGSIISAKWEHIDFDKKLWIIPAERMKMKREHILPLSNQVIQILKELKRHTGNEIYLFPNSQHKNRHMSNNTVNNALRKMGYTKEQIVAHGFRAMFSTICNDNISEHNISYEFIEKALAHQEKNEVREVYNRAKNLKEIGKLMEWYSKFIIL
ncbi:tyrosine-type recombinase/integrase [Campylobacterota bacterium DY0563]